MNRMNKFMAAVLAIVIFTFSSCAPSYVTTRPGPPVYARPAAPAPGYVWVNDNWVYRGGRYEYVHGYWAAPRRNQVWVDGNWQTRGNRQYWTPGRWKSANRRR